MVSSALTAAVSSLAVNQRALSIVAENIANANSENYTRREVTQTNQVVNGLPVGVSLGEVRRSVDDFLVNSARRQITEVGRTEVMNEFLGRVQLFYGQPGADNSLNSSIDNFFSSLDDLAGNPEQTFFRSTAIDQSVALTTKISNLARDLENTRFEIDQQISSTITTLNSLLNEAGGINLAIKETTGVGGDKNALLDQRDRILSDISKIIDVNVVFSDIGEISLFITSGELLSPDAKFAVTNIPVTSADNFINGDPISAIEITLLDVNGNLTNNKTTLLSASNATKSVNNIDSGELRGLIDLRDIEIPKLLAQLDELSETLKDSFNSITNDGVGFPAPKELIGTRPLVPAQQYNFSGDVRIAIIGTDGAPIGDGYGGFLSPLTIDLDRLDSGNGAGNISIQSIMDEINNYFGPPPANKVVMGKLDGIELAAISSTINTTQATGSLLFNGQPTGGAIAAGSFDFGNGNLAVGDTITIGGQTFGFKVNGIASAGVNIELGINNAATVAEIAAYLNSNQGQNIHADIAKFEYVAAGETLNVISKTVGIADNAIGLAAVIALDGANGTPVDTTGGTAGDSITIGGVTYGFIANGAASKNNYIEVGADVAATVTEIASFLNLSTNAAVSAVTYSATGAPVDTLNFVNDAQGADGNAFAVVANLSLSGSTLSLNGGGATSTPSGTLQGGGVVNGSFEFDFDLKNLASTNSTFEVLGVTVDNGAGVQVVSFDPYTAAAGVKTRTGVDGVANDTITVDLTNSTLQVGGVHTIDVQVRITEDDGTITTDTISYQVTIPAATDDIKNQRYIPTAISGAGNANLITPTSNSRFATARLVNADGVPVKAGEQGFLQIVANQGESGIAIDELDSRENGLVSDLSTATSRGLSHFFGFNDFFESGSATKNSAINFKVRDAYINDPSKLSIAELTLSTQSSLVGANPITTYEIGNGGNQNTIRQAALKSSRVTFDAAGTLPTLSISFSGYSSEIISFSAFLANSATSSANQEEILFNAFDSKLKSTGGVNIDEELANTIIFQNNYNASARMVSILSELFDTLIETF